MQGNETTKGLGDLIVESGLLNRISGVEGPPEVKETSSVVGSSRPGISKAAGVNLSQAGVSCRILRRQT